MTASNDERYMKRAIELAIQGQQAPGGGPIGCVIVRDGEIIGESYNKEKITCDPSGHAEIMAMREAGKTTRQSRFRDATLYSTLQPCGMCSMACIWAGISRIVYGAERHQVHSMYFEGRHLQTMDFIRDAFKDDLTVTGGVLGDECAGLYYGPDDDPPDEERTNT
jgi:tRNA(adenine34) deaminase